MPDRGIPPDDSNGDIADLSGAALLALTRDLCAFRTAVVADDNEALFARIGREVPLELLSLCFGRHVQRLAGTAELARAPCQALPRRARAVRRSGPGLAVAYYSRSFTGDLEWQELAPHLVSNPALPDALMFHCMWQYRPWDADWALSYPHRLHRTLGPGRYRVEPETETRPAHAGRAPPQARPIGQDHRVQFATTAIRKWQTTVLPAPPC